MPLMWMTLRKINNYEESQGKVECRKDEMNSENIAHDCIL